MTFKNSTSHISDDALELYSLQRLPDNELTAVEEHLLICHPCQDRLGETDNYIQTIRHAASALREPQPGWLQRLKGSFQGWSQPALGLGFAAALAIFFVVRVPVVETQVVEMAATRSATETHVSSRKSPQLQLDAKGLPGAPSYRVDVVDGNGKAVWSGLAALRNERLQVTIASPLAAGRHWVRIFGEGSRADLLREYALLVD